MGPLRLIILGILFYLLFRLLTGGRGRAPKTGSGRGRRPETGAARDVLVEDPVCHVYVPRGQAIPLQRKNRTVYFCSEKCRNTFLSQYEGAEQ